MRGVSAWGWIKLSDSIAGHDREVVIRHMELPDGAWSSGTARPGPKTCCAGHDATPTGDTTALAANGSRVGFRRAKNSSKVGGSPGYRTPERSRDARRHRSSNGRTGATLIGAINHAPGRSRHAHGRSRSFRRASTRSSVVRQAIWGVESRSPTSTHTGRIC